MENKARTIRIFLPDGSPTSIRIAEVMNWSGQAIRCPRSRLVEAKARKELQRAGVYILLGPDPDNPAYDRAYVGEGDVIWTRINYHNKEKDFWTFFIAFSSKDDNLTKSHIRYLESRMIEGAQRAGRVKLENSTQPFIPSLAEPDLADMEVYLDYMRLLLPTLGVSIFEPSTAGAGAHGSLTLFHLKAGGASATGYDTDEGFVVREDSTAVKENRRSAPKRAVQLKADLVQRGQLKDHSEGLYIFVEDVPLGSPSTAASVVSGQSISGPKFWKTRDGKTYGEHQQEQLDQVQIAGRPADEEG